MDILFAFSGALASVWIVAGIYIASRFYPGYSHSKQFCSELGAFGSPTQTLSPLINNYPLGVFFGLFGVYLMVEQGQGFSTWFIGLMLVFHGVATWITGYFPMDKDAYTKNPSLSCKIHTLAGVVLLLSLIIAPLLAVFDNTYSTLLRVFSGACLLGCFWFSYKLVRAFEAKTIPGIYQRLSYGCQILWLFIYSLVIANGH